jgi:hypothetical protein
LLDERAGQIENIDPNLMLEKLTLTFAENERLHLIMKDISQ